MWIPSYIYAQSLVLNSTQFSSPSCKVQANLLSFNFLEVKIFMRISARNFYISFKIMILYMIKSCKPRDTSLFFYFFTIFVSSQNSKKFDVLNVGLSKGYIFVSSQNSNLLFHSPTKEDMQEGQTCHNNLHLGEYAPL